MLNKFVKICENKSNFCDKENKGSVFIGNYVGHVDVETNGA